MLTSNIRTDQLRKWFRTLDFFRGEYPFLQQGEPPQYKFNPDGRLHCLDGPAWITSTRLRWYVDGRRTGADIDIYGSINYYYKDILVPSKYIIDRENLTFDEVITQDNAEVRRVGMEIYGFERMISEKRLKLIDSVEHDDPEMVSELYRAKLSNKDEEELSIIRVSDGTPTADGKRKKYILQVPPDMKTFQQAVAWTFRKEPDDYHPVIET